MKIAEIYSHLNGEECLLVHKKKLWRELQKVVSLVDVEKCKTKISKREKEKRANNIKRKFSILYYFYKIF